MIDLHTFNTPNGRKIPILLEELGAPYRTHIVHLGRDEQFKPEFLALSPNNKIPAIVDDDAEGGRVSIFESGAILSYLAEKHGRFLPRSGATRWKTLEWLYWQVSALGPMLGQLGYFAVRAREKVPPAIQRFTEECERLLQVMNQELEAHAYLGGNDYSIADIACYPWILGATSWLKEPLGQSFASKTGIHRWVAAIGDRPAVQRAMSLPIG